MLIAEGFEDILTLQKPPATATTTAQSQTQTQKVNELQAEPEILIETQSEIESKTELHSTETKIELIPTLAVSQSSATTATAAVTNIVPRFQQDLRPLIPVPRGAYRKIMVRTLCHYYYHLSCFSLTSFLQFVL